MASINDLATAATIASSAVALQSSPTQQPAQPAQSDSPPPPAPLTPSPASPSPSTSAAAAAATAQTPVQEPATTPAPAPNPAPAPAPTPTTPPAQQPPVADPSPAAATSTTTVSVAGPVLAAPQISPQNPAQAQIPAPAPPPPAAVAETADDGAAEAMAVDPPVDGMERVEQEKPNPVRGAFVVFEGMDRAGKTTQAKLLQQRFVESGREVRFMRFPDRTTPIGQMIDSYLKGQAEIEDHVIHLLFSANRWEAIKKIKEELAAGHAIICDRFYHSGIVYSAAKQNPSLSLSWAKAPEVGLPRPDVVLFLDLEEAVARDRGGWGGEVYEKGEMQRRVRELFWGLSMGDLGSAGAKSARKEGERPGNGTGTREGGGEGGEFRQEEEDIQIVDADLGVEELSNKVWDVVIPRVEAVERGEVGKTVRIVH